MINPVETVDLGGALLTASTLNSATPNTGWIDVRGLHSLCLDCVMAKAGSMTAVVATFTHRRASRSTEYIIPEIPAGGASAPLAVTMTYADGPNQSIPINVADFEYVKATFTGTGADAAGDTITVHASGTRE